jgi:hypothetical protein
MPKLSNYVLETNKKIKFLVYKFTFTCITHLKHQTKKTGFNEKLNRINPENWEPD